MTISHRYFPHPHQDISIRYTAITVPRLVGLLQYCIDAIAAPCHAHDVPFTPYYLYYMYVLCTLARRSILPMNIHYAPASHHHVGNWTSSLRLFTQ